MTTVSRTSQVTHSNVTGGGDWDHRLNRLLEDLQGTVVPPESGPDGGTEYREYRMTSSTRNNNDPPLTTDEKWVEYGTRGDAVPSYHTHLRDHAHGNSSSMSSSSRTCQEKTIGFTGSSGKTYGVDPGLKMDSSSKGRTTQIEYLTPANTTTVIKSGSSSPAPPTMTTTSLLPSSSPKVERKEFYAKASYTTLIKGGADGQPITPLDRDPNMDKFLDFPQHGPGAPGPGLMSTKSSSESRREYSRSTERRESPGPRMLEPMEPPLFTSTPLHQASSSSYSSSRVTNTMDQGRSMTPPPRPADGLKTPPLIRKMMQQSQSSYSKEVTSTGTGRAPAPITYEHDTPKPQTQYYTSTTTRNETRERESSPARRFPSPQPPKPAYGEPPKRLDELLATFDESYTETSKIGGDGGGPWKSTPYGPGTQPIRTVRIDDNVQSRNISNETDGLVQRKPVALVESRNVSGPPVFYPPGQIFSKTEEEALMAAREGDKGKAKMKMDRKYKAGEKSKASHSERGGQGAAPVPVCLPICCAAPCVIM